MAENGHPMDGKPFTPSAEPMPVSTPPVKKTRTEVVAGIFDVLESGEQTTADDCGRDWTFRTVCASGSDGTDI